MSSGAGKFDRLSDRLVPQPQHLRYTGGELHWQGEPFALQLQGNWTTRAHQQLCAQLRPFEKAVSRPKKFRSGAEIPLHVYCAELPVEFYPSDAAGERERYELTITNDGLRLSATTEIGVQRGVQTLLQLLAQVSALKLNALPCLRIKDQPAFHWRGVLIDVARHFIEVPTLLRTLDGMAHHKLNVLHLHLTDDQAFRFPSSAYPKLNEAGPSYTSDELRQVVGHAKALGIRVIPELDMPGHTTSWLAAYPEWSLYPVSRSKRFGVHAGCLDPTVETTYDFISTLLAEFAAVFPDELVHVGGDEVHPRWWSEHPNVQAFMADHGFAAPRDLQAYFNVRVADLLKARGKRMLVWDEAVHASLPKDAVVQAWRGMTARDAALASGHPCIVSAPYYLDLFYPSDLHTRFAPLLSLENAIAEEDAMLADPRLAHVAGGLEWTKQWRDVSMPSDSFKPRHVLGAEACLWSELVDDELLDVRLWSRLPLIAETFWRGEAFEPARTTRTVYGLQSWRDAGGPDLSVALGGSISAQQMELLAHAGVRPEITELLCVLEPSKWYSRLLGESALAARLQGSEMPQARPYDTGTPLRTIADVISPQSFRAAEFAELLDRWQRAPLEKPDRELLKSWLALWKKQRTHVEKLTLAPDLRAQLIELARRLENFSKVVRKMFDRHASAVLGKQACEALNYAELAGLLAPVGELLLAPVSALCALKQDPTSDLPRAAP